MSFGKRLLSILWAGVLAWLILMVGQPMWVALALTNLKVSPKIPWSAAVMALVLWLMWQYLGGRWWPRSTAETRRHNLRAIGCFTRAGHVVESAGQRIRVEAARCQGLIHI